MTRLLSILSLVILSIPLMAQHGHLELVQDSRVETLIEKNIFLNRHNYSMEGWRIQIFFDAGANSKRKATEALRTFNEQFPETEAYLSFKEPYYRVRVGDFRSRLEAEGFLKKLHGYYPSAFATSDFINPPPL
jgi:hypothetical protein